MVAADFSGFLFWRFGCVGCAANGCKIGNITTCWWNQDDFALSIFTGIIHLAVEKIRSLWSPFSIDSSFLSQSKVQITPWKPTIPSNLLKI